MMVSGSSVGQNPRVREPIVEALGDNLAAWFDKTTQQKNIETAYRASKRC